MHSLISKKNVLIAQRDLTACLDWKDNENFTTTISDKLLELIDDFANQIVGGEPDEGDALEIAPRKKAVNQER